MRANLSTRLGRAAVIALAAAVCGCTDTTGASPAHYSATASPTATPVPTATPIVTPSTTTSTVSTTASTTFALIAEGGYSELLTLPPGSAAVPVTETISSAAPAGVTPFSAARRGAAAARGLFAHTAGSLSARRAAAATAPTPLAYLDISAAASPPLTFNGNLSLVFTLPSIASGTEYDIAVYQNGLWVSDPFGATQSGSTLTFTFSATGFQSGSPTTFVLYSAAPGPELTPNTLTFDATAPGLDQTILIAEPGNTAAFNATISCAAATPAPTASSSPTPEPSTSPTADANAFVAQFSNGTSSAIAAPVSGEAELDIVGGDEPGTCTITVTDSNGLTGTATVNVDETDAGLYSVHRVKH